jgi:ABC-type lipoprotein export system ATPase subunit
VDFHTHTPESHDYANGEQDAAVKAALKQQTPEDWLRHHMAAGLDAVVVTDHNSTGFVSRLQTAYDAMVRADPAFRPLVIFPGFELSVNGGLHLLAVFDPDRDLEEISGVITACGYKGKRGETDNGVCSESFENCVKIIKDHGGLSIAAHIDKPCGLLWQDAALDSRAYRNLRNQQGMSHADALQQMFNDGDITSKIKEQVPSVGQTLNLVLEAGLDALEVRDWAKLPETHIQHHPMLARLARVTGSDSHMPRDIGRNGFSMVHMTQPNLEGLRMAFADGSAIRARGGDSVKESWSVCPIAKTDITDWNVWPDHAVEKITVAQLKSAGRVAPLEMPLHPRLNVLVGGRGSGKSTFVHALRLATQRGRELPRYEGETPVRESPAGDFWRWAQIPANRGQDGVILRNDRENSAIRVLYRSPSQSAELDWQASFLGQGARSSPPTVRIGDLGTPPTEDGGAYVTSRFPISIYSQKQVLEMSRGSAGLMEIIDREQNVASLEEQLKQAVATYSATRAKIRELSTTLANEAQDTASLKDIVSELEKIQSDAVKEYQRRQSQARALLPNLKPDSPQLLLAQELNEQADRLGLPDLPATLVPATDVEVLTAHTLYQNTQKELDAIATQVRAQAAAIHAVLTKLDQDLRSSAWFDACKNSKAAYEALLGAQTTAFDPARLTKLNQDRTQLETRLAKHQGTRNEIALLEASATQQLASVHTARKAISTSRESFVAIHNAKDTLLKLTVVPMGAELGSVERSLREAMGVDGEKFSPSIGLAEGARADSLLHVFRNAATREGDAAAVRQRLLELMDSTENEQGFADLQNNLKRQLTTNPSRRESIETWFPDDLLKLEYRTAESDSWKSISQGSIGQQTAAVLSFLLSFGNEPLVLDQPEDDLDTRMIMSLIVEQVRTMKEHRQIIIVTHNPNIVVHGDADLVHAMEDMNGQVSRNSNASGGLQEKATRQFICDVMEGGTIAFRKRFDRMGREET